MGARHKPLPPQAELRRLARVHSSVASTLPCADRSLRRVV